VNFKKEFKLLNKFSLLHQHVKHRLIQLRTGFSLVELLVVISVIAVLSVVGLVVYTNTTGNVNAARKRADINAIAKAYEVHYDGSYQTLQAAWFATGVVPTPPEGGTSSYFNDLNSTGFRVCANLTGTDQCTEASLTCYCKDSTQGEFIASYSQSSYVSGYTQSGYGGYSQSSYVGGYTQSAYAAPTSPPAAVQAPFKSFSTVANGNTSPRQIPVPASLVLGDLMIAQVVIIGTNASAATISPPTASWIQIRRDNSGTSLSSALFWKRYVNETGNLNFGFSGGGSVASVGIVAYDGTKILNLSGTPPYDSTVQSGPTSSNTLIASGVTTYKQNQLLLYFATNNGGPSYTEPSGMQQRYPGVGNVASMHASDQIVPNILTTTGTRAATTGGTPGTTSIGQMVSFLYADIPTLPMDSGTVAETSSSSCGANCTERILNVDCQYIPTRHLKIREYANTGSPKKGSIILTTGIEGNTLYSDMNASVVPGWNEAYDIPMQTRIQLQSYGFRVYELAWNDPETLIPGFPDGWKANTNLIGAGKRKAMCGYAAAVKWVQQRETALGGTNSDVICAQGNSAGGAQIAHGLAYYGLGSVLDMAIISGGPPFAGPTIGFGGPSPNICNSNSGYGQRFDDFPMGWMNNGNYANTECTSPPLSKILMPRTAVTSLGIDAIYPNIPGYAAYLGNYTYPNTKINFLYATEDGVYQAAETYISHVITSNQAPNPGATRAGVYSNSSLYPPNNTGHLVDQYTLGANDVRSLMNSECRNWP
jgi:prepilin-type N-terminal cleavage/methylation domain-containing protein